MDDKIIHVVYLTQDRAGQAHSLSVAEFWDENRDALPFFRSVLRTLANGRVYDDSDAPDTYCFYTTSDIAQLKTQVEAWYAQPDIEHTTEVEDWYENLMSA